MGLKNKCQVRKDGHETVTARPQELKEQGKKMIVCKHCGANEIVDDK